MPEMTDFETLLFERDEASHVATVTLNRPQNLNAFNSVMLREMKGLWRSVQDDDAIHAVVLRAAPGRAFCAGADVREPRDRPQNPWKQIDPGESLCPKLNGCWKPVVTAVHGMAAGGAFYLLNESDIVICSEDATFFDPHVTYGMVSALEPIGMRYRQGLGAILRMVLLGSDERVGAQSALAQGIVSEVTRLDDLWPRAHDLAARIAAKPPVAVQGTLRAVWESLDLPRTAALRAALKFTQLGNPIGVAQVDRSAIMAAAKVFDVR
jgi:enoyl-CoA hydratase/carnithine racemase